MTVFVCVNTVKPVGDIDHITRCSFIRLRLEAQSLVPESGTRLSAVGSSCTKAAPM
ncbi:hypothetical protein ABH991_002917 [Bradyrhizobium ottawaense]|uniref:Uncharacterized protein n=1 Tax=Bradyrhizobium ottawaense TaxID=931866 RepID=A0ABV4FLB6_9BRAD|nr:hypothetical protein BwSH12_77100 [Bradyrhizobium ottawaense]GMO10913.1 hypothetical protein BwSH20_76360 [Bradyrhizobium ottawaense]GMO39206.1 hypothetical protein BwSH14_49010 [Bradyrhizobium ottawaense]GMO52033.1 hypothetical protein BwSF21_75350 [Bradyrhizobium ottawaense]GMO54255.1 hypothetical protein BwSF12_66800 [Bradyrhizobium ottawaense]